MIVICPNQASLLTIHRARALVSFTNASTFQRRAVIFTIVIWATGGLFQKRRLFQKNDKPWRPKNNADFQVTTALAYENSYWPASRKNSGNATRISAHGPPAICQVGCGSGFLTLGLRWVWSRVQFQVNTLFIFRFFKILQIRLKSPIHPEGTSERERAGLHPFVCVDVVYCDEQSPQ